MADANPAETPPGEAAVAAGPRATDAFELLSNRTRLANPVALRDAYDQLDSGETVAFSGVYRREGTGDSWDLDYHLGKLTDHFVEESADGSRLREAGRHTLVSQGPVRIRVSVPGNAATLHPTLDGDLDVVDATEQRRVPDEATQ